jgi:hypothetical protein
MVLDKESNYIPPYYRQPHAVVNNRSNVVADVDSCAQSVSDSGTIDVEAILRNHTFRLQQHFMFSDLGTAFSQLKDAIRLGTEIRAPQQSIERMVMTCLVDFLKAVIRPHDPLSATSNSARQVAYFLQEMMHFPDSYRKVAALAMCKIRDEVEGFSLARYLLDEIEAGGLEVLEFFEALQDLAYYEIGEPELVDSEFASRVSAVLFEYIRGLLGDLPLRLTPLEVERFKRDGSDCETLRKLRFFRMVSDAVCRSGWLSAGHRQQLDIDKEQHYAVLRLNL